MSGGTSDESGVSRPSCSVRGLRVLTTMTPAARTGVTPRSSEMKKEAGTKTGSRVIAANEY